MADVPTNLPCEVSDRREHTARQEIAFDFRKPELDLVEPRRISRREVEVDGRMIHQERPHRLGLVRRQVVGDHVNLPSLRLAGDDVAEERDKRRAGMARHRLCEDFAGLRVERGEERQRAVTVLETVSLRAAGRQRQDRIEPVQRLNRGFLVDGETAA